MRRRRTIYGAGLVNLSRSAIQFKEPLTHGIGNRGDRRNMNQTLQELGIDRLDVPTRLELIGLIWDSIVEGEDPIATPEWHLRELEQRREAADANPDAAVPWEVIKSRLMRKP
jgi:putative addiction module component (TIGR02574 family)